MEEFKLSDIYEANGIPQSGKDVDSKSLGLLGFQDDQPPLQYFKFDDINATSMSLTNIIVAIGVFGGPVKFQAHVASNHCYTHTRNRGSWTGPYLRIRVFNSLDFLLLDWDAGQINVTCNSDYYHLKETQINSNEIYKVQYTLSTHRYSTC